jgi:dihydropyrimidinase
MIKKIRDMRSPEHLFIINGYVETGERAGILDIHIMEDTIVETGENLEVTENSHVIDATDRIVIPGVIDAHTHMGVPVKSVYSSDNFAAGSIAAAAGGVTTIIDFTVQNPGETLLNSFSRRMGEAIKSVVDWSLHCNITDYRISTLQEIPEVIQEGISSFKVFTAYGKEGMRVGYEDMRNIARIVAQNGAILMVHAEEDVIVEEYTRKMLEISPDDPRSHGKSRPVESEVIAIQRVKKALRGLDCSLYIVHLSSGSGMLTAMEEDNNFPVYLETCPQYIFLNEEVFTRPDGYMFVASPPIRAVHEQERLRRGVYEGNIHVIGTDHCPFWIRQKKGIKPSTSIPNGIPGVETLLPLMFGEYVHGRISLRRLVELLCVNPSKIFGLFPTKGVLRNGSHGDVVVMNPQKPVEIAADRLHSNTDWNPYEGMIGYFPEIVIRRGEILYEGGKLVNNCSPGRFIPSSQGTGLLNR